MFHVNDGDEDEEAGIQGGWNELRGKAIVSPEIGKQRHRAQFQQQSPPEGGVTRVRVAAKEGPDHGQPGEPRPHGLVWMRGPLRVPSPGWQNIAASAKKTPY
jgi:hypothetical protein